MKYNLKIDNWIKILFFVIILYLFTLSVLLVLEGIWFVSLITLPLAVLTLMIFTSSEIEFKEEYLYVKISVFFTKITYDSIHKIEKRQTLLSSGFALSKEVIRIHRHKKIFRHIDISPETRDEVFSELLRRCKNIKE